MNNIEFKAYTQALGLTEEQLKKLGGYKDARQIRRMKSAENKVHTDLATKLIELDKQAEQVAEHAINQALSNNVTDVYIVGYNDNIELAEWGDDDSISYNQHLDLLYRIIKRGKRMGINVHIVPFNENSYLDYIDDNNLPDNQASKGAWAASQANPSK